MALVQLSSSFHLPSILLICCHVLVLPKRRHGFGGVVNFCLSLLRAYWVLRAYLLAVLEISVRAYYTILDLLAEKKLSFPSDEEDGSGVYLLVVLLCRIVLSRQVNRHICERHFL